MNPDLEVENQEHTAADNENVESNLGSSSFDEYNIESNLGTSSFSTTNVIASEGLRILGQHKDLSFLSSGLNKRQRYNAKAVEWLSSEGIHLGQFRSGFEAGKALNLTQGDISLCCRAMRPSIGGYRFRFVNAEERPEAKIRRGFEPTEEGSNQQLAETRTTRASLFRPVGGEIQVPVTKKMNTTLLAPPELKVRKWRKVLVKLGNLVIPKWVSDQEQPTVQLQDLLPKKDISKGGRKRKSILIGRGSTAHEILGEYED